MYLEARWSDILEQVGQAAADYVTQEATGVPTYGGAPAYPVAGDAYSPGAPPLVVGGPGPTLPGWVGPLAIGAGILAGAKLFGLF